MHIYSHQSVADEQRRANIVIHRRYTGKAAAKNTPKQPTRWQERRPLSTHHRNWAGVAETHIAQNTTTTLSTLHPGCKIKTGTQSKILARLNNDSKARAAYLHLCNKKQSLSFGT
jgi:hypothetical protein